MSGNCTFRRRTTESHVDQRLHLDADANDEKMTRCELLAPTAAKSEAFLEGLPPRYLKTYAASEVLHHLEMSKAWGNIPSQLDLKRGRRLVELTWYRRPSLSFRPRWREPWPHGV